MVKEKSKDGGSNDPRADWKNLKELQAFCEFCAVQVLEGKRNGGFLTKTGVDAVIQQLGDMGRVATYLQIKNKWDHLKKGWRQYKECFDNETGLGYDAGIGLLQASDEWWTRKIVACPNAKTLKNKRLPNRELLNIMSCLDRIGVVIGFSMYEQAYHADLDQSSCKRVQENFEGVAVLPYAAEWQLDA
ncbi:uncharacterized protein LOC142644143 [Castanea sativa]|uniref:uncharacterized protein LOC142644143 n=1 Tax=Castanea sativa TaxID=21020 RepID=UPI003F6510E8